MNPLLFSLLFAITVLIHGLQSGFRSFSRIALVGYLEDSERQTDEGLDIVANYHAISHSLVSFSICLQMALFAAAMTLTRSLIPSPILQVLGLIMLFILFFQILLSTFTHYHRERILKHILFLIPLP